MKKSLRFIAFALIICTLFAALTACTIQPGYEGAPEGMRPINEGDEGAILYVPIGWSVESSTGIPTAYYSSNDRSNITLTTVSAEVVGERGAKEYFESYTEALKNTISDFTFVKEENAEENYTTRLIAGEGSFIYTYSGKIVDLNFKFRQAVLKNPASGVIYIITYSSAVETFDKHLDALKDVYDNFRFVTESIPMEDQTQIENPSSEGIDVPEGMKLISSAYTDYYFFAESSWVPTVTTGMTAAHSPDNAGKNISCTVFTSNNESIDDYWTSYESDITKTFGNLNYETEAKFSELKISEIPSRVYTYSITVSAKTIYYAQYVTVYYGQLYLVTAAADSFESAKDIKFELRFK